MRNISDSDISSSGIVSMRTVEQHPFFTSIKEVESAGFNQLYTAERSGKKWLLKGLKAPYRQQSFYQELLKKESDILMSLSFPYIVQAFGWEEIPQLGACIVMEYVDGVTLEEKMKDGLSFKQKMKIVEQLLEALRYVHGKQIVHRDLKPSNLLITHNGGNVKLIDFGLADTDAYRILKQPAGTLRYMAPEQKVERQPDVRNDIYSVGRILEDLHLGRSYASVIRRCLLLAAQRYEDVGQLQRAIECVRKAKIRWMIAGGILLLLLFLGFLTFQMSVIQRRIAAGPSEVEVVTPSRHENVAVKTSALEREGKQPQQDSIAVEAAIQEGKDRLDKYILSTDMEEHIEEVSSMLTLDYQLYIEVAKKASEILEAYKAEVQQKFNDEQSRYIYDQIAAYFDQQYLTRWNDKMQSLTQKLTDSF